MSSAAMWALWRQTEHLCPKAPPLRTAALPFPLCCHVYKARRHEKYSLLFMYPSDMRRSVLVHLETLGQMARLHRLENPCECFCIMHFTLNFFSTAFLYIKKEIVFKQWITCRTKRQSGLSFLCGTSDNHHFSCGYYSNSASSAATFSGTLKKNLLKFSSLTNWKLGFMAPTGVCQCNNSASRWFWFLLKLLLAAAQELSLWCCGSHCSHYEQCLIHLPQPGIVLGCCCSIGCHSPIQP